MPEFQTRAKHRCGLQWFLNLTDKSVGGLRIKTESKVSVFRYLCCQVWEEIQESVFFKSASVFFFFFFAQCAKEESRNDIVPYREMGCGDEQRGRVCPCRAAALPLAAVGAPGGERLAGGVGGSCMYPRGWHSPTACLMACQRDPPELMAWVHLQVLEGTSWNPGAPRQSWELANMRCCKHKTVWSLISRGLAL